LDLGRNSYNRVNLSLRGIHKCFNNGDLGNFIGQVIKKGRA